MASSKKGFEYMRLDVNFWNDEKIRRLNFDKKLGGYGIYVYLFIITECYRDKGSFVTADESFLFRIAEYFKISIGLVEEIILACVNVGLFDREKPDGTPLIANNARKKAGLRVSGILTSNAIQTRYVVMWQKAKRTFKNLNLPDEIKLISDEKIAEIFNENDIENMLYSEDRGVYSEDRVPSSEDRGINSEFEQQRKEKKRKENYINLINQIPFFSEQKEFFKNLENKNSEFTDLLRWWCGYKETTPEKIRDVTSLKRIYTRLLNTYESNAEYAEYGIQKAIDKDWNGFRELSEKEKAKSNAESKPTKNTQQPENKDTTQINIDEIARKVSSNLGAKIEISEKEFEQFVEVLFFEKRIKKPKAEAQRFIDYYDAVNWTLKSGKVIEDRVNFLRRAWKVDKIEKFPMDYGNFLKNYQILFKTAKSMYLPDYECLMYDFDDYSENDEEVIISIKTRKIYEMTEECDEKTYEMLKPAIRKIVGDKNLLYRQLK
jgi:predicted RNA-binding protein Jag